MIRYVLLRKVVSLILLYSFFIMVVSGIVMFISPFWRLAMMIHWRILGLGKMDYIALHDIFMIVFTIAGILHIILNFKAIKHYLKNRAKKLIIFTKPFIISTLFTVALFYATILHIKPLETFVKLDKSFNSYWIKRFQEERIRLLKKHMKSLSP